MRKLKQSIPHIKKIEKTASDEQNKLTAFDHTQAIHFFATFLDLSVGSIIPHNGCGGEEVDVGITPIFKQQGAT